MVEPTFSKTGIPTLPRILGIRTPTTGLLNGCLTMLALSFLPRLICSRIWCTLSERLRRLSRKAGSPFGGQESFGYRYVYVDYSINCELSFKFNELLTSIVWSWQGVGDRQNPDTRPLWLTFGENTARTWEGFRDAFNPEYVDGTVPIIDNGSSKDNDLQSGKVYATEILKGRKAVNVEKGQGADDETFDCTPGAANPCLDAPNRHTNWDFFNFYGYDPNFFDDLKPEVATDEIFHWWANFPYDMHSAYEGT